MKKTELTFAEGILSNRGNNNNPYKAFDWVKAAEIIKERLAKHPDLIAEAGLQGDWGYTGGSIFSDGKTILHEYTFLESNWAVPTIILSWGGEEMEEIECYEMDGKYTAETKWPKEARDILTKHNAK